MILVRRAPAYATIQDQGRRGFQSSGVPRAGAMDLPVLVTLNALLRNSSSAAAVEWALTGGELEFPDATTFAIGGAEVDASLGGASLESYRAYRARAGDVLTVNGFRTGRFLYVAVSGGIACGIVMGSRSTYVPGEFGGIEGRRLKTGDVLPVSRVDHRNTHQVSDAIPETLRPIRRNDPIRVVPRSANDLDALLSRTWRVSPSSDRTGYRLSGDSTVEGASVTSEPVCPGVIQLPHGGEPIVLMADAPTIGGYRIAGAVITADIGSLAQKLPGEVISLERISVAKAQRELDAEAERLESVREWCLS